MSELKSSFVLFQHGQRASLCVYTLSYQRVNGDILGIIIIKYIRLEISTFYSLLNQRYGRKKTLSFVLSLRARHAHQVFLFLLQPLLLQSDSVLHWKQPAEDEYKWWRTNREDNVSRASSGGYWPRGRKADGISLTLMASCTMLHKQINVVSPSFLQSPFWGTFNAQTCWCREAREHLKTFTDEWETVPCCSSGLLVSAFDLRDWRTASQSFSCRCIFLLRLQRECRKWRDPVMWKILHRFCMCFPHSERHFVFTLWTCCLYVLWPRSTVENIWLNPSGWFTILSFIRISVQGQDLWLTTGTTMMKSVFHVCWGYICQAWSWEQRGVRHVFDHYITFSCSLNPYFIWMPVCFNSSYSVFHIWGKSNNWKSAVFSLINGGFDPT